MAFAPITLGRAERVVRSPSFVFTETAHEARAELPAHAHAHHAVSLVVGGRRRHRFGSRAFDCPPGSAMIVPAGALHSTRFLAAGGSGVMIEMVAAGSADPALAGLFTQPRLCGAADAAERVRSILRELRRPDELTSLALECQGLELLVREARRGHAGQAPPWLRRIREALHAEVAGSPRLATLAVEAGVHPAHLAREFRRHFGASIGEYARRLRLARATELIDGGEHPLAEVATLCGFADQSHLTRAFRRAHGVTPGVWRRRGGSVASKRAPGVQDRSDRP